MVGINTATVQKYIRDQEKQNQIEDSLSKKEYEGPSKGSWWLYHHGLNEVKASDV